jgi:hypothetical protein
MTKNGNKSITWTSFNKPKQFTKGTDSTTFTYGPDRSRLSIGDGVDGAEVVVVEVAGFVRDGGCWRICCGFIDYSMNI